MGIPMIESKKLRESVMDDANYLRPIPESVYENDL